MANFFLSAHRIIRRRLIQAEYAGTLKTACLLAEKIDTSHEDNPQLARLFYAQKYAEKEYAARNKRPPSEFTSHAIREAIAITHAELFHH